MCTYSSVSILTHIFAFWKPYFLEKRKTTNCDGYFSQLSKLSKLQKSEIAVWQTLSICMFCWKPIVWQTLSISMFCWKPIPSIFKTVFVTTIVAHPYFWPKSGEHVVTLHYLRPTYQEPWKIPLASVCKIDEERGMQNLVAMSLFVFLTMGRKVEGGTVSCPPPSERGLSSCY